MFVAFTIIESHRCIVYHLLRTSDCEARRSFSTHDLRILVAASVIVRLNLLYFSAVGQPHKQVGIYNSAQIAPRSPPVSCCSVALFWYSLLTRMLCPRFTLLCV